MMVPWSFWREPFGRIPVWASRPRIQLPPCGPSDLCTVKRIQRSVSANRGPADNRPDADGTLLFYRGLTWQYHNNDFKIAVTESRTHGNQCFKRGPLEIFYHLFPGAWCSGAIGSVCPDSSRVPKQRGNSEVLGVCQHLKCRYHLVI